MPAAGGSRPIDLMIVGAPKAGTTSLKAYLGQHPDVVTHATREFIYFADDALYRQGYEAALDWQFRVNPQAGAARIAKSVAMMYSRKSLERLRSHNPLVQVVLMLREPVARAHSEFWYAKRQGREPARSFEEALGRVAAQRPEEAGAHDAYLARSRYVEHVQVILDLFPSSQVSVLLLEEFVRDPVAVCHSLFARLDGVDRAFAPSVAERHNEAATPRSRLVQDLQAWARRRRLLRGAFQSMLGMSARKRLRTLLAGLNEAPFEIPPLDAETRQRLDAYFAPWNENLETLLGRSLSGWRVSRRSAGTT